MLPSFAWAGNRLALAFAVLRGRRSLTSPAGPVIPLTRSHLARLAQPDAALPAFVARDAVARKYLDLLGPLDWAHFPERPTHHPWPGPTPAARAPYVAAYLVKLNEGLRSMGHLRRYLIEHPALVWCLGFPLIPAPAAPHGFDVAGSLPSRRQFGRVLRELDNAAGQFLLDATVQRIAAALPAAVNPAPGAGSVFGDVVAGDTKHILAWVKENNPKQYVDDRYNKAQQPAGDPDCKLGCKKRRNRGEGNGAESAGAGSTPTTEPRPASQATVGEFHWGYASGVIATKVPEWGEFVLAEFTQTFDKGDATYFFPLMQQVERRLGRRPRFGAFDTAYDAFYVHQYFHEAGGFAAVPLAEKGGYKTRAFSPAGLPLCQAGLAMPRKFAFTDRTTTIVPHERGKYVCPLRFPAPTAEICPVQHANWPKGGCTAMMPTCAGARRRYQLDRDSAEYKAAYNQRTADERINSQALALGIERPHLRRQSAIANQNTLIYVLINLRALQRVQAHKEALARQTKLPLPRNQDNPR
jgi:hypothetical protein